VNAPSGLRNLAWLATLLCLVAGCSHHNPNGSADGAHVATASQAAPAWDGFVQGKPVIVGHAIKPEELSATERKYGIAPKRVDGVVYQDNVVLLENGDKDVRAVDDNGVGWTLDANVPQVAALKRGDILFATSRCVGRVIAVERQGNDVKVILGPIQITDVIKEGNFSYDQPVDLHAMVAYSAPDYSGAPNSTAAQQMTQSGGARSDASSDRRQVSYFIVSPSGQWTPMATSARRPRSPFGAWQSATNGTAAQCDIPLPGAPGFSLPQSPPGFGDVANAPPPPTVQMVNGMQMYACSFDCGGLGLKLYQEKGGVKVWINAIFHLVNPHLVFRLGIHSNGTVNAHVALGGGVGFTVAFDALATKDLNANIKEVGTVPMDVTIPLGGMAVPLTAMFQQSLNLETAFSAKTSVLHAVGDFSASGDIAMDYANGHWNIPPLQMTLKNNLASAISGVSVGINSLVFAVDQRLLVGVGTLGFATGPYVNLISSITALKQASITAGCRQGTFGMQLGGGIGYAMPKVVAKAINFFLGLVHVAPVPSSGFIVRLKNNIPLVNLRNEIPDGCSG